MKIAIELVGGPWDGAYIVLENPPENIFYENEPYRDGFEINEKGLAVYLFRNNLK